MDLIGLLKLMLRRWLVVVPIVALAMVAAVLVHRDGDSLFEAQGTVLVTPRPPDATPSPAEVLDVAEIAEVVRLSDAARALVEPDGAASLSIEPTADNVLQVTLVGAQSDDVTSGVMAIAQLVIEQVESVQAGAGVIPDERVEADTLTEDITAVTETLDGETVFSATVGVLLDDTAATRDNPYAADRATGRLVQVAMESDAERSQVAGRSSEAIDYSITQQDFDTAPILELWVYGPTEGDALDGFDALVATMQDYLDTRQEQAGVATSSRVSIEVIAQPQSVEDVSPPISRTAAVTAALGIILALAAAVLTENIVNRRTRSQRLRVDDWWLDRDRKPPHRDTGIEVGSAGAPPQQPSP